MLRRMLSVSMTVLIILGMTIPTVVAAPESPPATPQPSQLEAAGPGGQGVESDPMSKLDGELRTLAAEGGQESVVVYALTEPGTDLSGVADVTETRSYLGSELVVVNVAPAVLAKLASTPGVVAAQAFHPIEPPTPLTPGERQDSASRESVQQLHAQVEAARTAGAADVAALTLPQMVGTADTAKRQSVTDWNGADLIGASDAWAKGYDGDGVNIAIIDSGVDFGHPDLEGSQATYEDGPYEDWPIALDPRSMRNYVYNGLTSWDNYNSWWDYSWYAGVYDILHCTNGEEVTFEFKPDPSLDQPIRTYTVSAEISALSLSGEIRWSVHPDEQLADFIWDGWVPFILLDTTTAGVYDTVIADLNFDFWFDSYDDTAVLGSNDPILNQDLGSYVYTDTLVSAGTQYVPSWWLGNAPTWYGTPEITTQTVTLTAGSWIYALDHNAGPNATDGADGIADVSGGMVYYIADGVRTVPGMDYLYPQTVDYFPQTHIPVNGQLVAFMLGSYWAGGGDHGTLCASAAAARGEITGYFGATGEWVQYSPADDSNFPFPSSGDMSESMSWLKSDTEGTVQGAAPGAKIIAIGDNYEAVNGMQGFYDAYTFLAMGVDGEPNSGDEFVNIVSMSFGDGTVHNDGWDWESRLISTYNEQYLPNTTFFASSGNGGPGYGTINSPQGNTTVSVGASTQYGASDVFGGGLSAAQINEGDVQPFSGRGPDAYGRPDPDVVATGAWGAGNTPLNLAPGWTILYRMQGGWFLGDGNNAWYEWGGTSRSAPEAAGVMALIYDAYYEAHGSYPDYETARQIMMSSADDLSHDVLIQGAGRVNADRATDIASKADGVYVEPSLLAAGEYDDTHYQAFTNLLYPSDTWTQTFTVHNPGATAAAVTVGDELLMETETQTYSVVAAPYTGMEDSYIDAYYAYANYFVVPDPDAAEPYAFVRGVHAAPYAGGPQESLEICIDGNVVRDSLVYTDTTGYMPLPAGTYLVQAFADGSDCAGTPVISTTSTFAEGSDTTIMATDYFTQATAVVLSDNNSTPVTGKARVRFVHGSPDTPAVDIAVSGGGAVLFSDVAFQQATAYTTVDADTYNLEVRLTGTPTVLLTVPDVVLEDGEVTTLFAMGLDNGTPALEVVTVQDTPLPVRPVGHGESLTIPLPDNADFMEVQLSAPFELFDFSYEDPDPSTVSYQDDERWSLTVYDWTDRNADGELWVDANDDGIVNPQLGRDSVDTAYLGVTPETELNRFSYAYNYANAQEVVVRLGDRDDIDNVVVGLVHRTNNDTRPGWGADEYQENPLTVKVTFYEKADWDLVTESPTNLSVGAGGAATFDAIFAIPADQAPGLYEGAITVDDGTHLSIIPTTVNVGVPGDDLLFTLGGEDDTKTPYDNARMERGYTWYSPYEQGDWRFFYYDADAGLDQQYLYVRNRWGDCTEPTPRFCEATPTFNETVVFGPNPGDQFSMADPDTFGPYGMQYVGGTEDADGPQAGWGEPRQGSWWTDPDGTAHAESRAWATLWDGLNMVEFRNILLAGKEPGGCPFEATAGVFGVGAPETGITIETSELSGDFTLDAVSPVDGILTWISGFGDEVWFRNQDVPQGTDREAWPDDLMDGWVHTFVLTDTQYIEVSTFGPDSSDIDLYLLYDANGDGLFNPYDSREALANGFEVGPEETIGYNCDRKDGTYAVVMVGWDIMPGDQFDLRLRTYGDDGLTIEGADPDTGLLPVTPGTMTELALNWDVPDTGVWYALMAFAMPREDAPEGWEMGPEIYVPVTINVNGIGLHATKTVDRESLCQSCLAGGHEILTYRVTVTNNGNEDAWIRVADLLPDHTIYYEQWIDDPDDLATGEWFVAKWWYENGAHDYFWPDDDGYIRWEGWVGPSTCGTLTIEYKVKVDVGFAGTVTNVADIWASDEANNGYHTFLSPTATTDIHYCYYMPFIR